MGERESGTPESDATIALLSVTLDRQGDQPLVRQLYQHLRDLILARRIAPGARLPSTRKLSRDLPVSRRGTLGGFGQVSGEGFLEARLGLGHFGGEVALPQADPGGGAAGEVGFPEV